MITTSVKNSRNWKRNLKRIMTHFMKSKKMVTRILYPISLDYQGLISRIFHSITNICPNSNRKSQQRPRLIEIGIPISKNTDGYKVQNIVKNQKYSIFTFIPLVLFDQFRYFFNLFFLIITLSQFIPVFKVGFLFSYVAPLVFVLTLTLLKEAYDDWQRYKRDNQANSYLYCTINSSGGIGQMIKSYQIKVGDIIEVKANERVPADIIILETSDQNGTVFLRTDQLDGETDWKLRHALKITQKNRVYQGLTLIVEPPKSDIYDFKGVMKSDTLRESISLENTAWANTYVAAGSIIGLVIYTGKESKISMNSKEQSYKMGRLDQELNYLSKILFLFMCLLALIIVLIGDAYEGFFLQFFRHVLLLSSIIPISLRVNLDFSKLAFSWKINNDQEIQGAKARNSQIPEELGRVSYVLSDKTGTLTQNQMIFKRISLEVVQFNNRQVPALTKILRKQFQAQSLPNVDSTLRNKKPKEQQLRDFITALILCHNVTPIIEDHERKFQGSSPDEIALVNFAEQVGISLKYRSFDRIVIQTQFWEEEYEIAYEFPFTSERKRMGIILKNKEGQYYFYLKGADVVMKNTVPEVQKGFLLDECEMLSREGLRTLVVTQKYLSQECFDQWQKQYEEARSSMGNREKLIEQALNDLEKNMDLLGITGVEDKLQDDIQQTIEQLRNAGIKLWMLTGDKLETAQCISISAGIKQPQQEIFIMKEITDSLVLQNQLNQIQLNTVIAIDGVSLQQALDHCLNQFLYVACLAPAVICCRCSPTQKAQVVEAIKNYTKSITLAIGDGGNDVAMIQSAHIGVGIEGKEGKQAALASDFSLIRFKDLSTLLLWHGRLAYKRCSVMSQFVMHRGLVISVIQFIFSVVFYQVAIPIYNGWLMLGYATIFTMLPVFCLIFDEDISREKAHEYPELYKSLLKGREITSKTFLLWLLKSIYQGMVIMTFSFLFFKDSFLNLVTVTFTALILIELLNVYSELHQLRLITFVSQFLTFVIYFSTLYLFKNHINVGSINLQFGISVLILVVLSWLPLHIGKKIKRRADPTDSDKIMMKINTNS